MTDNDWFEAQYKLLAEQRVLLEEMKGLSHKTEKKPSAINGLEGSWNNIQKLKELRDRLNNFPKL